VRISASLHMAYLPADFILAFPLFALEPTVSIQAGITSGMAFGGAYNEALGCLVAHNLATAHADRAAGLSEDAGDITSQAAATPAGQISRSRGTESVKMMMKDPFMRTRYGQRYRYLANLYGLGGTAA
jgi:hypothetical protein